MNRPLSELSDQLLLVEGPDDQHVVRHLWERRHGQGLPFQISPRGGVEGVIESIRDEARALGRQALGILVDANESPATRRQAISDRLASVGIQTSAAPHPGGLIINATDEMPRVGIWLMPDNQSLGELEDFVAQMIPDNDPVWPLSQDYIGRIPKNTGNSTRTRPAPLRSMPGWPREKTQGRWVRLSVPATWKSTARSARASPTGWTDFSCR